MNLESTVIRKLVHRLVAQHFIQNPLNLPCVCHKIETLDENGLLYNGVDNLFWGTQKDNIQDMYKKGRDRNHWNYNNPSKGKFGKDSKSSKQVLQYSKEGVFILEWGSIMDAERELGICGVNISACCRGRIKSAGGFRWVNNKKTI